MPTPSDDVMNRVRRDLASWHATHPRATFAEMEVAVEEQIEQLRATLLQERAAGTWQDEHPACPHCGTTMMPRTRAQRTMILPGEEAVPIERVYVICPVCETGLFPPG
jgi:NADH pyrophosphatase NudC (nudix superfamily)